MAELSYKDLIAMSDDAVVRGQMRLLRSTKGVEPPHGVRSAVRDGEVWKIQMWHPGDAIEIIDNPRRRRALLEALGVDEAHVGGLDGAGRLHVYRITRDRVEVRKCGEKKSDTKPDGDSTATSTERPGGSAPSTPEATESGQSKAQKPLKTQQAS